MRGAARSFSQLKVVLKLLIVTSVLSSYSYGKASFTHKPTSPQYLSKGGTAELKWTYSVDNKTTVFAGLSPTWNFNEVEIGNDWKIKDWKFRINNLTCPPQFIRPTVRISKKDQATLVIKNVSTGDSGVYKCTLALNFGTNPTETAELIVTATPTFTVRPNATTSVVEHTNLNINCTAFGPPLPNVTWLNVTSSNTPIADSTKGSAILSIPYIQRHQNGIKFKCTASNNPNQRPVETKVTTILVYYAPEIKSTFVKRAYCIWDKANITVSVDGNPKPSITCKHGQLDRKVQFIIENDDQYGNYTCKVTNSVGSVTYVVQLIKTNTSCQPTKPTPAPSTDSVHPGIIAGAVLAAILLIVGVVIAIIFWRRRKTYKRDSTTSHNQTVHMNDLDDGEEHYATAQHANRVPAPKEEPTVQYAVVDKSKKKKKKQPGELIYADLDHEATPSDRPPSDRRPTGSSDQDTVYADINRAQEETPRYGNLKQMDNM